MQEGVPLDRPVQRLRGPRSAPGKAIMNSSIAQAPWPTQSSLRTNSLDTQAFDRTLESGLDAYSPNK
eukprot:5806357-Amphidinium_carterae.1